MKCHPSCPNSCFGPHTDDCSHSYIEYFHLSDRDYAYDLGETSDVDLETAFNAASFTSKDYTVSFWAK